MIPGGAASVSPFEGITAACDGEPQLGVFAAPDQLRASQFFVVMWRATGALICLPDAAVSDSFLTAAARGGPAADPEYGPHLRTTVECEPLVTEDEVLTVPVLLLDIAGGLLRALTFSDGAAQDPTLLHHFDPALPTVTGTVERAEEWISGAYEEGYWTASEPPPLPVEEPSFRPRGRPSRGRGGRVGRPPVAPAYGVGGVSALSLQLTDVVVEVRKANAAQVAAQAQLDARLLRLESGATRVPSPPIAPPGGLQPTGAQLAGGLGMYGVLGQGGLGIPPGPPGFPPSGPGPGSLPSRFELPYGSALPSAPSRLYDPTASRARPASGQEVPLRQAPTDEEGIDGDEYDDADDDTAAMKKMMIATTRLVHVLAQQRQQRDPVDLLMGGSSGGDDMTGAGFGTMTGAKGTAALEMQRRDFEAHPRRTTEMVRFNMGRAMGTDPRQPQDAHGFFSRYASFKDKHEFGYIAWLLGAIWNAHELGQVEEAHALTGVGLAMLDQAMLSGGNFRTGYLWTHLPEPPWGVLERPRSVAEIRPYSRLASPVWVASTVAYFKDLAAMDEHLHRDGGGGGGNGGRLSKREKDALRKEKEEKEEVSPKDKDGLGRRARGRGRG